LRLGLDQPSPPDRPDEILAQEPEHIAGRAAGVGQERLDRSLPDMLLTGFVGGIEVSLGALGAMLVLGVVLGAAPRLGLYGGLALGGLVFPVGFFFVVVGRSELFTENFLIPVVGALGRRSGLLRLAVLWGLSWLGNLLGCALVAGLLSVPEAIGPTILRGYAAYSAYKLDLPLPGLFVSALLAGMIMTVLTWLLLAVPSAPAKAIAIWAAGYVLFATNLSHVIVSAAILFVGFAPSGHDLADVARYVGVTSLGNLAGGLGLVTCFRLAQVWEKRRQRRQPGGR
jgi:formate/nitrite transporter FocA (FNT family)